MAGVGGGLGSVLHMINTLKNNRNLLRKSNIFRRNKEHFEIDKEDYLAKGKIKIENKTLSKQELEAFKSKIKKENKRLTILYLGYIFIATIIMGLLIFGVVKKLIRVQKEYERKQERILEAKKIKELNKKKKEYLYYIKDGDLWLTNKNYYNAIYQYKLALSTKMNDKEAARRLIYAYSLQCINNNLGCENTIYQLKQMIKKYPSDREFYELIINCKEIINDTAEMKKYYNEMNNIPH